MRRRSRRLSTLLAAAITLGACHYATDPIAEQQSALDRAQARWLAAGVVYYSYDVATSSMWGADSLGIIVADGAVTSVTVLRGDVGHVSRGRTVPELFALIRDGIARGSDVRVSYDAAFGFPTLIDIPDPPGMVDSAWSARVGNFLPFAP